MRRRTVRAETVEHLGDIHDREELQGPACTTARAIGSVPSGALGW